MPGLIIASKKLYQLYASYFSIMFGGTIQSLALKWIYLSE